MGAGGSGEAYLSPDTVIRCLQSLLNFNPVMISGTGRKRARFEITLLESQPCVKALVLNKALKELALLSAVINHVCN